MQSECSVYLHQPLQSLTGQMKGSRELAQAHFMHGLVAGAKQHTKGCQLDVTSSLNLRHQQVHTHLHLPGR